MSLWPQGGLNDGVRVPSWVGEDKTDIKYCKCGEKVSNGEDKCHYCDIIDRVYNQLEELVGQDIPCLGWSPKDLRYTLFLANGEKLELSLCWSGDADEPRD